MYLCRRLLCALLAILVLTGIAHAAEHLDDTSHDCLVCVQQDGWSLPAVEAPMAAPPSSVCALVGCAESRPAPAPDRLRSGRSPPRQGSVR